MMHYKQIYDSKEFIKFDFGQEERKTNLLVLRTWDG